MMPVRRAHVIRDNDQYGRESARPCERLHRIDRGGCVVRPGADNELRAPFDACVRAGLDDLAPFIGVERARLPGRPQRNDPPNAGVEEADRVVFLCDARAGLTPQDEGEEYTGAGDRSDLRLDIPALTLTSQQVAPCRVIRSANIWP